MSWSVVSFTPDVRTSPAGNIGTLVVKWDDGQVSREFSERIDKLDTQVSKAALDRIAAEWTRWQKQLSEATLTGPQQTQITTYLTNQTA